MIGKLLRMFFMCLWILVFSIVKFVGDIVGLVVLCWMLCFGGFIVMNIGGLKFLIGFLIMIEGLEEKVWWLVFIVMILLYFVID